MADQVPEAAVFGSGESTTAGVELPALVECRTVVSELLGQVEQGIDAKIAECRAAGDDCRAYVAAWINDVILQSATLVNECRQSLDQTLDQAVRDAVVIASGHGIALSWEDVQYPWTLRPGEEEASAAGEGQGGTTNTVVPPPCVAGTYRLEIDPSWLGGNVRALHNESYASPEDALAAVQKAANDDGYDQAWFGTQAGARYIFAGDEGGSSLYVGQLVPCPYQYNPAPPTTGRANSEEFSESLPAPAPPSMPAPTIPAQIPAAAPASCPAPIVVVQPISCPPGGAPPGTIPVPPATGETAPVDWDQPHALRFSGDAAAWLWKMEAFYGVAGREIFEAPTMQAVQELARSKMKKSALPAELFS